MENYKSIFKAISSYKPQLFHQTIESAGVMVIFLLDKKNNIEIVLTKRSPALLTYAGDFSFPGGVKERNDNDLYATAARETQEEINISESAYQKLGQLDDFKDRFGRLVRPFVVAMKKSDFIKMQNFSDTEITEIYLFPLAMIDLIQDNPDLYSITRRRPSYSFSDGSVFIWGLTAAILVHIGNIIKGTNKSLGKSTYRVDDDAIE